MNEFLNRQIMQIQFAISDFREGRFGLNTLVHRLEAIGNALGGVLWEEQIFPLVLDLEGINSELIDKKRTMNPKEQEQVNTILKLLETISSLR